MADASAQPLLVFSTTPDMDAADRLAAGLVEARLAACVNCLPGATSIYRWEGRIERASEVLLVIKTTAACWEELQAHLAAHHPYSVPECVALAPSAVERRYLAWLSEEVRR